jgi:hypothetical protein
LFSPGGNYIALHLQLWSAPPPARWGNSVLSTALSSETNSGIHHQSHFGRLACCLTPTPSLCYFSSVRLLRVQLLPHPHSLRQMQYSTPTLLVVLDCILLFMLFSFVGKGMFNLPRGYTRLCSWGVSRGVTHSMCCSPVSFYRFMQAALEPTGG